MVRRSGTGLPRPIWNTGASPVYDYDYDYECSLVLANQQMHKQHSLDTDDLQQIRCSIELVITLVHQTVRSVAVTPSSRQHVGLVDTAPWHLQQHIITDPADIICSYSQRHSFSVY